MYQAKRYGKGSICYFDESLARETRYRAQLEQELRDAITNNEFRLMY